MSSTDPTASKVLRVGISSRALFDLEKSNAVFETHGMTTYAKYQIAHEDSTLEPGAAFTLVKKLLKLNENQTCPCVEVILLSRNSADTGLRIFNSIQSYQLPITRAVFTGGHSPFPYLSALGGDLFLSTNEHDVRAALQARCAAATILTHRLHTHTAPHAKELRIAFDGDAVLFSDESEKVYQKHGLDAFSQQESACAKTPLSGGPFKGFLSALQHLQSQFDPCHCPIRTALITARSAPAHARVIHTLRYWGIRIDEALFLGGKEKSPFLKAFNADIFFDDQRTHCDAAHRHVPTGHVPHGIMNSQSNKSTR